MKKIAFIGATGFLGKPVAQALIAAGFDLTILSRNIAQAQNDFPTARHIKGSMESEADLEQLLAGQDAVYLSLSVKQEEAPTDFHTEEQGIDLLLKVSRKLGLKRVAYLSSLVKNYQNMNGFDWWAFKIKNEAVEKIKSSGIPYSIFYPSTFFENLNTKNYRQGNFFLMVGDSEAKMWWISSKDYAAQVVKSFEILTTESREYVNQGHDGLTTDEAMKVFNANNPAGKLRIVKVPIFIFKFLGKFNQKANYGFHICEALNKYPEEFAAQATWQELGEPTQKLTDWAKER
jgi:nucleoside-diphosphate-sugar epimerase